MCGIVGVSFRRGIYRKSQEGRLRRLFTEMLVNAQSRGSAATGVVLMSRENDRSKPKALVLRSPLPADKFVESADYKKLLSSMNQDTLSIIGHTRAVTGGAGAENNKNNHPHIAGSVVGVHNGRVVNDTALWNKYGGYMIPKGHCDSEVVFALINRKLETVQGGTEQAIAEAVTELKGWWALALVNLKEPQKVFLLRDDSTPLEVAWWTYGEAAVFGSDYDHLNRAFKTANPGGHLRRYDLKPRTLVTLDSTVSGDSSEFFVHSKQLAERSALKQAELIAEHKDDYETTQGRTQGGHG